MSLAVHVRKRMSGPFELAVQFEVAPGVTIVFGESGSGKTTLLRAVAGLVRPDEGRIAIDDRVLFDRRAGIDLPSSDRHAGFVFQHLALFPHLTAADNIAYGLAGRSTDERRARTLAIAESFRIAHLLGRRPPEISGGERQRVGLARSLVTDPAILLLDEPLSALDHLTQSRIIDDVRRWNEARRIPILYVTHSQREVFALGERVLVLQGGRIIADGTPQQVLHTPAHEHVAELAGFENMLDAVAVSRRPESGTMTCRVTNAAIDLETPLLEIASGAAVRVAIRAGDILLATERPHGLSARNVVPGVVRSVAREGAFVRADIDVGVRVEVHVTPSSSDELQLGPGRAVWIVVKTHSCHPIPMRIDRSLSAGVAH